MPHNVLFYTKYTHPTLICRGTDACTHGRTDARTDGRTENIYSIFRDKLLLLGEHVLALWIRRARVYQSFIRFHKGRIKNRGNLKRAARQCNISNPLGMSIQEIALRLKECKKECLFYQEHGKRFRWKHLETRKKAAQDVADDKAFQKVCAIIQREQQWDF